MRADGSSQFALAKLALLIIRPGTSRHYRLGRVIKSLEKVPAGGSKKPVAVIDQHLELLLFLLSGGKIVDRKRHKDSNRLHCLVKLATLLATFRRFDCRLNLIEIDLPKSPAREVGLEQIDVTQGSHHVGRIIIKTTNVLKRTAGDFLVACAGGGRSEEHTSELQSLMRSSYAVFCL